jgi:hypothetical protein
MFKRLLIGIIVVGAVAVFWTGADSLTSNCKPGTTNCKCVAWTNVGGTSMCCTWRTKGVLVEVDFKQDCGAEGENCSALINVESENSIAFCQLPTGEIRKTECTEFVSFSGAADQCEPKHDQDGDNASGGQGHDKGKHACTSTTAFTTPDNPASCQAACEAAFPGSLVVDVTPIEMDTTVRAFAPGDPYYEGEGPLTACPEGSPSCGMEQHCTIDPKKIQFDAIRPYQCVITDIFVPEIFEGE